jgi:hypothetical protein
MNGGDDTPSEPARCPSFEHKAVLCLHGAFRTTKIGTVFVLAAMQRWEARRDPSRPSEVEKRII